MVYSWNCITPSFLTFFSNWQHGTHFQNFICTQRRPCFIWRTVQSVLATCSGSFLMIAAANSTLRTFHVTWLHVHDARAQNSHVHQNQPQARACRQRNHAEHMSSICWPTSYMLLGTMSRRSRCMVQQTISLCKWWVKELWFKVDNHHWMGLRENLNITAWSTFMQGPIRSTLCMRSLSINNESDYSIWSHKSITQVVKQANKLGVWMMKCLQIVLWKHTIKWATVRKTTGIWTLGWRSTRMTKHYRYIPSILNYLWGLIDVL